MIAIKAADLFCGAGGASTGLIRAATAAGLDVELLAVNHWPTAVDTHTLNHPGVRHMCEAIERIDPRKEVPGGRLHILLAGPECTHHASARGGRPMNDQSRATAWHILKWAQELYIDNILIENVPEFRGWGPLGANGRPLKSKKGETYRAFLAALRSLGYDRVEDRIVNCADYGDPTTRRRLFILAQRGRRRVFWPETTHSRTGSPTLFATKARWRPAREIIDWQLKGRSIFGRKKPLAPATLARIFAGLEKFGGPELQPFLVVLRNHAAGRSLDGPLPTISAQGTHIGLCQPFVLQQQSGGIPRSTNDPLPTIATDGAISLVRPYLVPLYGERDGQDPRTHSVDDPVPTIPATGGGKFGLVEPYIVDAAHGNDAKSGSPASRTRSLDEPLGTVTGSNRFAVAEPFIIPQRRFDEERPRVDSIDDPLRTITAAGGRCFGLAEPFITKYNGTAKTRAYSVDDPLDTVTSKERFGLCQPVVNGYALDIRFRMLQPHELAQAMSFPSSYQFTGTREDIVKQIGNAWPGETAKALCSAIVAPYVTRAGKRAEKENVA